MRNVADEMVVPASTGGTLKRTYAIFWPARTRKGEVTPRLAVGFDERTNASAAAVSVMVAADAESESESERRGVPSMRTTMAKATPALTVAFTRTPPGGLPASL